MAKLQRIDHLSDKSVQNIINSSDIFLFDVDGVLVHNSVLIPGSDETIKKLRSLGKRIGFVTNNSLYPLDGLSKNLERFGATEDEIVSPNLTIVNYLKKTNFQKDIYLVGSQVLGKLLRDAGYTVIEYKDIQSTDIDESLSALKELALKTLQVCKNVGAIILDLDVNHRYGSLQTALVISNHIEGVEILNGMSDDLCPISDNLVALGPHYCIDAFERWTGKTAVTMGKPSKLLADFVNTKYKITDTNRVLMVGDNIATDIAFGALAGYQTCLVLSGIATDDQVTKWNWKEDWKPDFVANKFGDFLIKIKDM